jgi:hypothetical protein
MSKTIKTPKPEDTTVRWFWKAVNADGTVANGTYRAGINEAKYAKEFFKTLFFKTLRTKRKAG